MIDNGFAQNPSIVTRSIRYEVRIKFNCLMDTTRCYNNALNSQRISNIVRSKPGVACTMRLHAEFTIMSHTFSCRSNKIWSRYHVWILEFECLLYLITYREWTTSKESDMTKNIYTTQEYIICKFAKKACIHEVTFISWNTGTKDNIN